MKKAITIITLLLLTITGSRAAGNDPKKRSDQSQFHLRVYDLGTQAPVSYAVELFSGKSLVEKREIQGKGNLDFLLDKAKTYTLVIWSQGKAIRQISLLPSVKEGSHFHICVNGEDGSDFPAAIVSIKSEDVLITEVAGIAGK